MSRATRNHEGLAHCFVALAVLKAAQGQAERSARILGAVEALLDEHDIRLRPRNREVYTHTIAALRTQIDEAAFSYMWAAGRVMALEQAIAYALQETDVPDEGAGAFHDVRVPG